ncbi:hypothetical protein DFH29DRAFT_150846 [Suillus ampliporus]|nr:hypothetical protein DFH29DRAFT_150846 [Suillus ampliporus]
MASAAISRIVLAKHLRPVVVMNPSAPLAAPCVAPLALALVNPGTSTGQPWKCVDVKTDATTCGGCLKPSPFGDAPVTGVNCKEIKDVIPDTVTCGNGHCIVKDCAEGYFVSPTKDSCSPLPKSATAGSSQRSGAAAPGSSASTGSTEGLKVSRDELTATLVHGAGIAIAPLGGATEKLVGGVQVSPAGALVGGAQGAGVVTPIAAAAGGITGSLKVTRDVTGGIQHGAAVVVKPIFGATEGLVAGASAGPAGVIAGIAQGASAFSPVAGVVESTSAGLKATRDVAGRLTHSAGATGPWGAVAGVHGTRGVAGVLMHGASAGAKGVKATTGTTAGVNAA